MNIEESVEYLKNCLNDEYNFKNATRKKDKEAIETLLTAYEKEKEERKRIGKLYYEANENCIKYEKKLEKEKEKNKELEYIIASNTTREVISNLKNSRKSREDLEMLDLGWKEELKEKFQNTRNEILSQTLIKVTDRYCMDKCLEYINNLEKEVIGEE